jgi:hypothetical protein
VQAGDPGLRPDEQRRLRNRALARWLIAVGPAWPQPGSQPISAELVLHDGRACAAITTTDGQVLALYPFSGNGERRRLYQAVPVPYQAVPVPASRPPVPPPPPRNVRADLVALRAHSRALRQASMLLCARSQELCAVALPQRPARG